MNARSIHTTAVNGAGPNSSGSESDVKPVTKAEMDARATKSSTLRASGPDPRATTIEDVAEDVPSPYPRPAEIDAGMIATTTSSSSQSYDVRTRRRPAHDSESPRWSRIAESVARCHELFKDVLTDEIGPTKTKLLIDQFGRFRIWATNMGADQHGAPFSLAYKLRDSSVLESRVRLLLGKLETVLARGDSTMPHGPYYLADNGTAGDVVEVESQPDDSSTVQTEDGDEEEDELVVATQSTVDPVQRVIDLLFRYSVALQNPARHDAVAGTTGLSLSHYLPYDIEHVRNEFPRAKDYMVERLGKAISRRRVYLQYLRQKSRDASGHTRNDTAHSRQPLRSHYDGPSQATSAAVNHVDTTVELFPEETSKHEQADQVLKWPTLATFPAGKDHTLCPLCHERFFFPFEKAFRSAVLTPIMFVGTS